MLGLAVVLVGGMFLFIGANAFVGGAPHQGAGISADPGDETPADGRARRTARRRGSPTVPRPGIGWGRPPATARTRRIAGVCWVVVGVGFIVAALTHQVP